MEVRSNLSGSRTSPFQTTLAPVFAASQRRRRAPPFPEACGLWRLLWCRQKAMLCAAGIHVITHDLARGIDPDGLRERRTRGVDRGERALV